MRRGNHRWLLLLIMIQPGEVDNISTKEDATPQIHAFCKEIILGGETSTNILNPPKMVLKLEETKIADYGGL